MTTTAPAAAPAPAVAASATSSAAATPRTVQAAGGAAGGAPQSSGNSSSAVPGGASGASKTTVSELILTSGDRAKLEAAYMASAFKRASERTFISHTTKGISTVGWSCDGKRLATGSTDKTAKIWTLTQTGDLRTPQDCKGHTESVLQLKWDPNHPDRFATCSTDHSVRIWDARSVSCITVIKTEGENINLAWSPDGTKIAVVDKEDRVTKVDTKLWKAVMTRQLRDEFGEINEVGWNLRGDRFYLTTGSGSIKLMDDEQTEAAMSVVGHTASAYCLDVDPTGRYIATGGSDALTAIWDERTFSCVRTIDSDNYTVRSLSFTYDGQFIAMGTERGVNIAHVDSGEIMCHTHHHQMNTLAWNPREYLLAYAGEEWPGRTFKYGGQVHLFSLSRY